VGRTTWRDRLIPALARLLDDSLTTIWSVPFRAEIHTVVGMSPRWRILRGSGAFSSACCGACRSDHKEGLRKVKNLKKAAAVTMMAGGLVAAGAGFASATDAHASGEAIGSPGIASGNVVQVPVDVDSNVSGNTVNVVGLLNPAFNNAAIND